MTADTPTLTECLENTFSYAPYKAETIYQALSAEFVHASDPTETADTAIQALMIAAQYNYNNYKAKLAYSQPEQEELVEIATCLSIAYGIAATMDHDQYDFAELHDFNALAMMHNIEPRLPENHPLFYKPTSLWQQLNPFSA